MPLAARVVPRGVPLFPLTVDDSDSGDMDVDSEPDEARPLGVSVSPVLDSPGPDEEHEMLYAHFSEDDSTDEGGSTDGASSSDEADHGDDQ
mgnify:CR=1 FL=1